MRRVPLALLALLALLLATACTVSTTSGREDDRNRLDAIAAAGLTLDLTAPVPAAQVGLHDDGGSAAVRRADGSPFDTTLILPDGAEARLQAETVTARAPAGGDVTTLIVTMPSEPADDAIARFEGDARSVGASPEDIARAMTIEDADIDGGVADATVTAAQAGEGENEVEVEVTVVLQPADDSGRRGQVMWTITGLPA